VRATARALGALRRNRCERQRVPRAEDDVTPELGGDVPCPRCQLAVRCGQVVDIFDIAVAELEHELSVGEDGPAIGEARGACALESTVPEVSDARRGGRELVGVATAQRSDGPVGDQAQ